MRRGASKWKRTPPSKAAEEAARAEGSDPGVTDTVVRQQLELRKSAAEQAAREAQQRIKWRFGSAEACGSRDESSERASRPTGKSRQRS